jgi:ligand-binding sensor domain-containing protein
VKTRDLQTDTVDIAFDASGQPWLAVSQRGLAWPEGNEWVCYGRGSLSRHRNTGGSSERNVDDGPLSESFSCMVIDRQERKWLGSTSGVSCWDGKTWTHYTDEEGLPEKAVTCAALDGGGQLWFGTRAGAACFAP